jgi:predicted acylesterase/phospholipase RssA
VLSYCRVAAAAVVLVLAGCAHVTNLPINQPVDDIHAGLRGGDLLRDAPGWSDEMMVGLAFSGGGMRAAAFSFGVLKELARSNVALRGRQVALIDHIDFVTGVSGGAVPAAYFGLKRRAALEDFRERFLIRNAEEELNTAFSLGNLSRAVAGGVNEDTRFRSWLDANLFEGATFSALLTDRRPRIWINATDIYNGTPFVFGKTAFSAICSDLANYPIASAVAASAAVPLVFSPIVLEAYPDRCNPPLPDWIEKARANPNASPLLRAFAQGIGRYRDGTVKYIKLLDGGLVDNFGLSGFTIGRESSEVPYGPLTQAQAARIRRVMFLIVDSGQAPQGDWARVLEGPSGADLVNAVTGAALYASVRASYTAFQATMENWRTALVRWRCGLPPASLQKLRGGPGDCRDLKIYIGRIGFDQFDPERATRLGAIETRFRLPVETVDELIAAGGEALAQHPTFLAFRKGQ